ncbi:MAG TPA: hypothetical protein PKA02_01440 [Candidatus Saccharibacteria bacterium]|nr:hypothetical protein [Candidatus Saccharibacteria bacterium]
MSSLENRVAEIEKRNQRVELDKAWETSWTRRLSIACMTYVVVTGYLIAIDNDRPFINALVPVVGFLLSTSLLKTIRNIWQRKEKIHET